MTATKVTSGLITSVAGVDGTGGWILISKTVASGASTFVYEAMTAGNDYKIIVANHVLSADAQAQHMYVGVAGPTYRTSGYVGAIGSVNPAGGYGSSNVTAGIQLTDSTMGNADTGERGLFIVELIDPATSGTKTHYMHDGCYHHSNADYSRAAGGGHYGTAEANTAIKLSSASGTFSSEIYVYRRPNA
jgi:hypothetical protein|tara:strand:+ start:123 stop:689 length:567 start_codon:yes stop_codon:yes gene_type:complete